MGRWGTVGRAGAREGCGDARERTLKLRLLEWLRCPSCRGRLRLRASTITPVERRLGVPAPRCSGLCPSPRQEQPPTACEPCAALEIVEGTLTCEQCGAGYPVHDSVPRMVKAGELPPDAKTARTAVTFGHLWGLSAPDPAPSDSYHFEKMATALSLAAPHGLVMDAGCGDGTDLSRHAARAGVEVIGVELSDGGCATSAARVRASGNAHVVQADLRRLPFAARTFEGVYSYGVLHHTASPPAAAAELFRVTATGGVVAIYLYEDFGERALAWRIALAVANSGRALTTRTPPRLLYALCRIASPLVYLTFTVPHLLLRSIPGFRTFAGGVPFRHGRSPFSLTGDLYDRFSAPIEYRYSRTTSAALLAESGLTVTDVAYERGWMVSARLDGPTVTG